MMARSSTVAAILAASICAMALVARVEAGADKVAFPEGYATGVRWLVANRPATKEVHEHFVTPAAIEAARKDLPMPSGTVFTAVRHAAKLDPQGNPITGADGFFVKGEIVGFGVMEKRTGWGSEYPDALRNGEWEYRPFTADRQTNEKAKLTSCFKCHKPQASHDFVHAYDKLKDAAR